MSEESEYLLRDAGEVRLIELDHELLRTDDAIERALLLLERSSLQNGGMRLEDSLAAYEAAPQLSHTLLVNLRELVDQEAFEEIETILRRELELGLDERRVERAHRLFLAARLAQTIPEGFGPSPHESFAALSDGAAKAVLKERAARIAGDRALLSEALFERERASLDRERAALFRLERLEMERPSCEHFLAMARAYECLGERLYAAIHYLRAAADPSADPSLQEDAWLQASRIARESAFVQSFVLSRLTDAEARHEIATRLDAIDPGDAIDQLSEGWALLQAGKIGRAKIILHRAYQRSPSLDALLLLDRALELSGEHETRVALIESHLSSFASSEERAPLLLQLGSILETQLNNGERARARIMEAALGEPASLAAIGRLLSTAQPRERLNLIARLLESHPESELAAAIVSEELLSGTLHPELDGAFGRSPRLAELLRYLASRDPSRNGERAIVHKQRFERSEAALLKIAELNEELAAQATIAAAALALARGSREDAAMRLASISRGQPKSARLTPLGVALEETLHGRRGGSHETRSPSFIGASLDAAIGAELQGDEATALRQYLGAEESPLARDGLRRLASRARSPQRENALQRLATDSPHEPSASANAALLELAMSGDAGARSRLDPRALEHALEIVIGGASDEQRAELARETLQTAEPSASFSLPSAIFPSDQGLPYLLESAELSERDRRQIERLCALFDGAQPNASRSSGSPSAIDRAFERERALGSLSLSARAEALLGAASETAGTLDLDLLSEAGWAALEAGDYKSALAAARRIVILEPDDLSSLELLRSAAIGAGEYALASSASLTLADLSRGRRAHLLAGEAIELYLRSDESPELAGDLFEECIRRGALTPGTLRSLSRRAEAIDREAQRERLIELLGTLGETHTLHTPCLLELAFLDRDRGAVGECRRWLERIRLSGELPVEALELHAEIAIEEGDLDDAISTLQACLRRRSEPAARAPLLRWLAKLLRGRGDATEAIGAYEELRAMRELTPGELEDLSSLYFRIGRLDDALAANLEAATKLGPRKAADIHLRAAKIARQTRGGREIAKRLYRSALRAAPDTADAVIGLHQLSVDPAEQRRIEARIVEIIDQRFPLESVDIGFVRSIADYARAIGDPIRAAAVAEALNAIGAILPDTFELSDEYTQVVLHDELDPRAILHAICEPAQLDDVLSALALIESAGEQKARAESLGFTLSDRIRRESASPLRDELNALGRLFGETEFDLLRGGTEERALFFSKFKKDTAFFAGALAKAPLSRADRFSLGAEIFSYRRGSSALLGVEYETADEFAADLHRAAKGEPPTHAALSGLALGFLERRTLRTALERCGSIAELIEALRALLREHDRARLLAVGDLHETLRLILGRAPDRTSVERSARALALFSFFIDKHTARFHRFYGAVH